MTTPKTQRAVEQWLREHFKKSIGDPEAWPQKTWDKYHEYLGLLTAMMGDLELTVKE